MMLAIPFVSPIQRHARILPRTCRSFALVIGLVICLLPTARADSSDQDQLTVLKHENIVYVRSALTPEEDIVIQMRVHPYEKHMVFGDVFTVPSGIPMDTASLAESKWLFHSASSDNAPWNINDTLIGANHGANEAVRVMTPGHSLSEKDLGSRWSDGSGISFYLVKIPDDQSLLFLSENQEASPRWKFETEVSGNSLKRADVSKTLTVSGTERAQFYPANRIQSQQFLADGTPLEDGIPTQCKIFEAIDVYDILNPGSVLEAVHSHPGKALEASFKEMEALLTNRITYQFQPYGACVINLEATAHQAFKIGSTALVQSAALHGDEKGGEVTLSYLIPKTLIFTVDGIDYDFDGIQNMDKPLENALIFSEEQQNISDPKDLPDRAIQFLQQDDKKIGFAIGYSLLDGMTIQKKRAESVSSPLAIFPSRHIYLVAIDQKAGEIRRGDKLHCVSYRQYFSPEDSQGAATVYGHVENGAYVLYAEFQKGADRLWIPFPEGYAGKSFDVVEKSDSVRVLSQGRVEPQGVAVSVKESRGSLVLKVPHPSQRR